VVTAAHVAVDGATQPLVVGKTMIDAHDRQPRSAFQAFVFRRLKHQLGLSEILKTNRMQNLETRFQSTADGVVSNP